MTDEADKPAPAGDEKDAKEIEINVPAVVSQYVCCMNLCRHGDVRCRLLASPL